MSSSAGATATPGSDTVEHITLPSCNLHLIIFDYDGTCSVEAVISNPDTASHYWFARHIHNVYTHEFLDPKSGLIYKSIRKTTDAPRIKKLYDWLSAQPVVQSVIQSDQTELRTISYQDLPIDMKEGGGREMVVRVVDAGAKCASIGSDNVSQMVGNMGARDAGFLYTLDPWLTSELNISVHDQNDKPVGPQFKIDDVPTLEKSGFEPQGFRSALKSLLGWR